MLTAVLTAVLSAPATLAAAPIPQGPTFEARLDRLVERLEEARVREHIPGMALAVVQGNEVVLTHGFGSADLESGRPVTPETIFGVGSTTKAFTATLVGMLADDGVVNWDDAVSEYLPFFELDTGDSGEQATLRDLLCHRSGFTRMSTLVMNPEVPRRTILETAAGAEPWAPFRKEFHYSNVMFLAAGVAAGEAAGSSWEELVATKIFEPLGMKATRATYAGGQQSTDLASGYLWNEDTGEYDSKPVVNIDGIGPAGAITSNAIDMAQWLRFQLGRGEVNGQRLISEENLAATWTGQIQLGPGVSYGLGWFVREWHGQPLIEHGGNVGGFAAQVAFLPDSQLGYVLLTNVRVTPLQIGSIAIVFDTLLGDWETDAEAESAAEVDYDDYVGKYVADFGTWEDVRFTVQTKGDRLAVDVPGQTLYELKNPDEDGKWFFALTDEIAVSFDRDEAGDVVGMKMYQSGFAFELPREGVEIAATIPLEDLQRYLGEYESDDGEAKGRVVIQNNRLAVDIPGEMVFELHTPDDRDRWVFRVRSNVAISFQDGDDGKIQALTLHRAGNKKTLQRVGAASTEELPTLDDIMALRKPRERLAALDASSPRRSAGTVRFVNAGLEGSYEIIVDGRERYSEEMDFGPFGITRTTVNGDRGWSHNPMQGVIPLTGDTLEFTILGHPAVDDDLVRALEPRVHKAHGATHAPGTGRVQGRESLHRLAQRHDVIERGELFGRGIGDALEGLLASRLVEGHRVDLPVVPISERDSHVRAHAEDPAAHVVRGVQLEHHLTGHVHCQAAVLDHGTHLHVAVVALVNA